MKASQVYLRAARGLLEPPESVIRGEFLNDGYACIAIGIAAAELGGGYSDHDSNELRRRFVDMYDATSSDVFGHAAVPENINHRVLALLLMSEIAKDEERK